MNALPAAACRALDAYGGEAFWRTARSIRATVSTTGLAFVLKWQRPFERIRMECTVREPHVRLTPIDRFGNSGLLKSGDVSLEDSSGIMIASRQNARSFFPYGRRLFWWDSLDQTYFAGYALWNYLAFPALLMRKDIRWEERGPHRLMATFPEYLPTHCREQEFLFDPVSGFLRQHNYTADVMGGWAKAANRVLEHGTWNGVPYPSHRLVTPRKKDGSAASGPVLIDLMIHDWHIVSADVTE